MATPTMATILHTPQIAAAIDSCTEIIPGMPATRANLKILLDRFSEGVEGVGGSDLLVLSMDQGLEWLDGGKVVFSVFNSRQKKSVNRLLKVTIRAPAEWVQYPGIRTPFHENCIVDEKVFILSEDGLVTALAWAKERATRLKAENYCTPCRVDGARTKPTRPLPDDVEQPLPRKKLKISGASLCVDCTFKCAVFGKSE